MIELNRRFMESGVQSTTSFFPTQTTQGTQEGPLQNSDVLLKTDYGSWHWVVLLSIFFSILYYAFRYFGDIQRIKKNWKDYRCNPAILPFASLYGFDTTENFNFCIQQSLQGQMGKYTGPFAAILTSVLSTTGVFLQNLNSLRVMMANLTGGISKVLQELVERAKRLMFQVRVTGLKTQQLFRRMYGVLFAVMYIGLSAITAGQNFMDTTLFKFLDTFCFPGDTLLSVSSKGLVPIKDIQLGDTLEDGSRVTSVYRFFADGQSMVSFPPSKEYPYPIHVSGNHYIQDGKSWVRSDKHPEARKDADWSGGTKHLLYCIDTDTHRIPIGSYVFSDYDETHETDAETMRWVETRVNGESENQNLNQKQTTEYPWKYQPCCEETAHVQLQSGGSKPLSSVRIGDVLTTGEVVGLVKRHVYEWVQTSHGTIVTPSTLLWTEAHKWERAGHLYPIHIESEPRTMIQLVVKQSCFELSTGEVLRDFVEYHSPDAEDLTESYMCKKQK